MIINFKLFEQINYDEYTHPLTKDEFLKLAKEKCDISYLTVPFIIRGMERKGDYFLINTDKHLTIGTHETLQHKLLFKIADSWEGYPKKSKSLDVLLESSMSGLSGHYGTEYYVIPFNGARYAVKDGMLGYDWKHQNDIFPPVMGGNGYMNHTILSAPNLLQSIIYFYEKITDKTFNIDNMMNCFDVIDKYLRNNEIEMTQFFKDKVIYNLKERMLEKNMKFGELIMDYFDPVKNDIKLYNNKNLRTVGKGYQMVAWTDSKVLMIRKDIYEKEFKSTSSNYHKIS